MLQSSKEMGALISLTEHFLRSHLEFFPKHNGDVTDEHGKKFYLDFKLSKKGTKEMQVLP